MLVSHKILGQEYWILAASSILQTLDHQPWLLFVKFAGCNSVSQMQSLSLPLHRRKTQTPSPSMVHHLFTSMQSGFRLCFRESLSYFSWPHCLWLIHLSPQGSITQIPTLIHLAELICLRQCMLIWTSVRFFLFLNWRATRGEMHSSKKKNKNSIAWK